MESSKANKGVIVGKNKGLFAGVRYEHLLAGITGGVTSTLILHPLDLLKVRFAVPDTGRLPSSRLTPSATTVHRPQYNGVVDASFAIWKTEGARGFYKGVTPNLWGAGTAWGCYFLFYNVMKTHYQETRGGDTNVPLGPGTHMLAAAQAGVGTLLITNPVWVVKTRLCLQYDNVNATNSSSATRYNGMVDALRKTYKHEGIRGLYKGLVPGLLGVSHGALQFMAYEELKLEYNRRLGRPPNERLSTMEYLSCAAVSKLFAAVTTYPYQVLRARMQDQHAAYDSLRMCIRFTWSNYGARGFYRGLVPNLLRVVPATAVTFVMYENVVHSLMGQEQPNPHPTAGNGTGIPNDASMEEIAGAAVKGNCTTAVTKENSAVKENGSGVVRERAVTKGNAGELSPVSISAKVEAVVSEVISDVDAVKATRKCTEMNG